MNTAVFSWELVPLNADPAWPAFDRLISRIDADLGAQQTRLVASRPAPPAFVGYSSAVPNAGDGDATVTSFAVLSAGPRGLVFAPLRVESGMRYIADLLLHQNAGNDS